jgi:adenine phosphoribosyltransferase
MAAKRYKSLRTPRLLCRKMADTNDDRGLASQARALVKDVPDYPERGVVFKDITPVLADGEVFARVVDWLARPFFGRVDVVAAIEARGFLLGAPVARTLGVGLVPVRKHGKLPGTTMSADYVLEYGQATLEVHADAIAKRQRVLVVDDVLATGGTMMATVELVRSAGAAAVAFAALLSIPALGGENRLEGIERRILVSV